MAENVDYFNPIGLAGFSVSANGVLAYHSSDRTSQLLWINRAGVQTGTVGPVAEYEDVRLSPDGKRLAYHRIQDPRTNATDVRVFDLTRGTDTRITSAAGSEFTPIWSPDGRQLVVAWDRDAPPYLHQIALDNLSMEPLVQPDGTVQTPGDWHPSGTSIVYGRTDHDGRGHLAGADVR